MFFFMLYEICKGEESFWYPYFEITDKPFLMTDWSIKDLNELQDEALKEYTIEEEQANKECFQTLREVAECHPDIFDLEKFTYENFKLAKNMCDSRCFGSSLPSDMIVPFADLANHHVVDMTVEVYNKRLHDLKLKANASGEEFECDEVSKHYYEH